MTLKEYFDEKKGVGVMATANAEGKVDTSIHHRMSLMTGPWRLS
jgi:hypothetical protein